MSLNRLYGVKGVYLSECQSYPLMMELDVEELLRADSDGPAAYSPLEIFEGDVVVANREVGFWSTRLCQTYPNPLLVKLVRALWAVDPDATVFGEAHWGRGGALMRSGVVPHVRACPRGRGGDAVPGWSASCTPRCCKRSCPPERWGGGGAGGRSGRTPTVPARGALAALY